MKKKKLISVIVPTFNHDSYIARCLRSLLTQSLSKDYYEIIIINDRSNDQTSYILNLFKEDIVVIDNKKKYWFTSIFKQGNQTV